MKKVLFLILLLSLTTRKTFAHAEDPKIVPDTISLYRTLTISLNDWKAEAIQMKIICNADGNVVYSDQLNGLYKDANRYLISNLEDGHYKMDMEGQLKFNAPHFVIINKELWLSKEGLFKIFQPVVKQKGRYLDITMLVAQERAIFKFLDKEGEEMFRANIRNKDQILRRIDLRNLRPGRYTLITSTGGKSYYKDFKI